VGDFPLWEHCFDFPSLTLLVESQEGHPVLCQFIWKGSFLEQ